MAASSCEERRKYQKFNKSALRAEILFSIIPQQFNLNCYGYFSSSLFLKRKNRHGENCEKHFDFFAKWRKGLREKT
uniref:Uncharacterized protein n=1 Tax=Romanomermis culicivorax TaxID=13658 RepID=A0A915JVJ6_ROMCU